MIDLNPLIKIIKTDRALMVISFENIKKILKLLNLGPLKTYLSRSVDFKLSYDDIRFIFPRHVCIYVGEDISKINIDLSQSLYTWYIEPQFAYRFKKTSNIIILDDDDEVLY